MTPSDHVSNTDYHEWIMTSNEKIKEAHATFVSARNRASLEGLSIFYGAGGRTLLKKMAEYFECYGKGRYSNEFTSASLIYGLLDGNLDIVRVQDGKGFWHEEGYTQRPALITIRQCKAFTIWVR